MCSKIKMISAFILLFFCFNSAFAQVMYKLTTDAILIEGTSNVHDWEMTVEEMNGNLKMDASGDFSFESIQFTIPVKSLKSGKSRMDKNTYEALKEDKHKHIQFESTEVVSSKNSSKDTYEVVLIGNLTIAGTTKSIQLPVLIDTSSKKITAKYDVTMTEYNVDPPTAVFGTIKTGDDVTINFSINYSK